MDKQLVLVPDKPLELESGSVTLSELAHEVVPEPPKALEDSIGRFGLLQPILIRMTLVMSDLHGHEHGKYQYDIVDGRRRLAVCRKLGIDPVPCMIAETDLAIADVATLALNATRSANPIAEFDAIDRLTKQGASLKEIAGATGMAVATIKARQSLLNLDATLVAGFRKGEISASVAHEASKLPATLQEQLATQYMAEGKVTGTDLHEVKLARTQAALTPQMFDLDGASDLAGEGEAGPLERELAMAIMAVVARMPKEQGVLTRSLQWVAGQLFDIAAGQDPAGEEVPEPDEPWDQSDVPMQHELADDERGSFHAGDDEDRFMADLLS